MSADQERGWRALFHDANGLSATFRTLDVQVNGDAARASVEAIYEYRTDRAQRFAETFTAQLERGAAVGALCRSTDPQSPIDLSPAPAPGVLPEEAWHVFCMRFSP
ncbi:MAG: hypothetical protein OEO17_12840, partial [Gemmatimonadota bacterium]|nr:hypothetical protein [Gemmatimonadota bacterium]